MGRGSGTGTSQLVLGRSQSIDAPEINSTTDVIVFSDQEAAELLKRSLTRTLQAHLAFSDISEEYVRQVITALKQEVDLPEMELDPDVIAADSGIVDRTFNEYITAWNEDFELWQRRLSDRLRADSKGELSDKKISERVSKALIEKAWKHNLDRQALLEPAHPTTAVIRERLVDGLGIEYIQAQDLINLVAYAACDAKAKADAQAMSLDEAESQAALNLAQRFSRVKDNEFLEDLPEAQQKEYVAIAKSLLPKIYNDDAEFIQKTVDEVPKLEDVDQAYVANQYFENRDRIELVDDLQAAASEVSELIANNPDASAEQLGTEIKALHQAAQADILYEYLEEQRSNPLSLLSEI